MASVKIIRPPLCADPAGIVPENLWPELISARRRFCRERLPSDDHILLFFLEDGERSNWLGYGTRERYLSEGLQLDPEMVELALRGLEIAGRDKVNLEDKRTLVKSLWYCVNRGGASLANVPALVHRIIETGVWREHVYCEQIWRNGSFLEFITSDPPKGCGWPPEKVEALIKDDAVVLAEWREATTGQRGGDRTSASSKNNNIMLAPVQGTGRSYTLGRLKHERPDLFEKVVRKEMSANAAAIAAGFRKKLTALDQIRKLWAKLPQEERTIFWNELMEEVYGPTPKGGEDEPSPNPESPAVAPKHRASNFVPDAVCGKRNQEQRASGRRR